MSQQYQLPQLPYALNALEPVISADIMSLHYNKHHAALFSQTEAGRGTVGESLPECWYKTSVVLGFYQERLRLTHQSSLRSLFIP